MYEGQVVGEDGGLVPGGQGPKLRQQLEAGARPRVYDVTEVRGRARGEAGAVQRDLEEVGEGASVDVVVPPGAHPPDELTQPPEVHLVLGHRETVLHRVRTGPGLLATWRVFINRHWLICFRASR